MLNSVFCTRAICKATVLVGFPVHATHLQGETIYNINTTPLIIIYNNNTTRTKSIRVSSIHVYFQCYTTINYHIV